VTFKVSPDFKDYIAIAFISSLPTQTPSAPCAKANDMVVQRLGSSIFSYILG